MSLLSGTIFINNKKNGDNSSKRHYIRLTVESTWIKNSFDHSRLNFIKPNTHTRQMEMHICTQTKAFRDVIIWNTLCFAKSSQSVKPEIWNSLARPNIVNNACNNKLIDNGCNKRFFVFNKTFVWPVLSRTHH